ncbi:MAG: 4-hydroxythreonine-4-phosphate dehydrogenase PdxA [Candidatus Omnitrophota bacterium]
MSKLRNKVIAVTMGDPCGVGPEVTAAALSSLCADANARRVQFIVIGNERVLARYWPKNIHFPTVVHLSENHCLPHNPGRPTPESGLDSLLYLEYAVKLLQAGTVDGLVTGPLSKEAVIPFYPGFKGHTTFLADAFSARNVEMMFVAEALRVVLVTRHVPLKDVPAMITSAKVFSVIASAAAFVRDHMGVKKPKVAVCGLNPHAGEGGHMGREEIMRILPAVRKACLAGWDVTGPLPADTLFEPGINARYDLIAAMYHDQALTALKAQYFNKLVNVTVGLPFIRTSPAHGTAFGIAGKGLADPGSMGAAIKLAAGLM